jgi:hypothetical protein
MDFTDLGKGVEFMYKGEKFEIPSYTKPEMTQLMDISEKMVALSRGLSEDEKESMDKGEIKTDELKKLFSIQQEFIIAGVKQCTNDGVYALLTLEKIEPWPWRLCNKISSLIQEMMNTISIVEKGEDNKKGNPTKEK